LRGPARGITGASTAASSGSGVISAAIWTFVVLLAVVLLGLEWRAVRTGRPSVLGRPGRAAGS
jgi:hypothetical protein